MENYLLAAAIATIAPGLLVKGCSAIISGSINIGSRMVYGKQKTTEELQLEELQRLNQKLEEKLTEINNRERNIDVKLEALLKHNYIGVREQKDSK